MRDCPTFGQWQLAAANRGSFGSLAINDLSRAEAQSGRSGWLQTRLCPATDASAALVGLSPRTGARPAPRGVGTPQPGLVSRAGPGRLERERGRQVISYESIYRFIYAQIARTTDFSWRRYLPRGKSKRGIRGHKGGSPASFIEGRVALAKRPVEVADRSIPGHWEAVLMMFAKYGQAVLTVHERTSRLLLGIRLASKVARGVARHLVRLFAALPQGLRQTVTFDNGTEFACHLLLHSLSIETFFCDPHAPWQKGGIENAIGRMRRFIPRKTDLATLSTARFRQLVAAYNNTPRKCLDFRTPAESFAQVLHFECESTSRPSPGRHFHSSPCAFGMSCVGRMAGAGLAWVWPMLPVVAGALSAGFICAAAACCAGG